uniref:Uncharacterized protein n=1 Tax=Daucus carota subsp. sativus TaxID=79200 RepID=A0A164VY65_DAUCS
MIRLLLKADKENSNQQAVDLSNQSYKYHVVSGYSVQIDNQHVLPSLLNYCHRRRREWA